MLGRLYIRNLAIIDELEIQFRPGFNLLTGETGAGKSILIDAISLLVGGKAPQGIVRSGEKQAVIEGEFSGPQGQTVIRRILRANGSSRAFINDAPVKLAELQEATAPLVDLHGQHEHQSLLRVKTHIDFLDSFARLSSVREQLAQVWQRLNQTNREIARLEQVVAVEREKRDLLEYQLAELEKIQPSLDEDLGLSVEHRILGKAQDLKSALVAVGDRLRGDNTSIASELTNQARSMGKFAGLSLELNELTGRLSSLIVEIEELETDFQRYNDTVRHDPKRMQIVEERLGELESLKRKFGGSMESVMARWAQLKDASHRRENADEQLQALQNEARELGAEFSALCAVASAKRHAAKDKLATRIETILHQLDMVAARFQVRIIAVEDEAGACDVEGRRYRATAQGMDQVEFYISPNKGEEPRPLVRIASGGEVSRIMLGIKSVLADHDPTDCLIFDEIDNGISGSTAEIVGANLAQLATRRQVICITHLPQIAARTAFHLKIWKEESAGRTVSRVQVLTPGERQQEVARLLSGQRITQASLDQAGELMGATP